MKTVFLRVLEAENKAAALLAAVQHPEHARDRQRFEVDPQDFRGVPLSPFAYWVGPAVRELFAKLEPFEHGERTTKQGLVTGDDFRLVRLWGEVPFNRVGARWRYYAKGGALSSFYSDIQTLVGYDLGDQVVQQQIGRFGRGATHYYRPGLTWPLRASRFAPQVMPVGCIFSARGYSAFAPDSELLWLLGVFNSSTFDFLFKLLLGRFGYPEFIVGILQLLPIPGVGHHDAEQLGKLARAAWWNKRRIDTANARSHAFILPALLQVHGADLPERASAWSDRVRAIEAGLAANQAEIDNRCFTLYDIDEADRHTITEGFGIQGSEEALSDGANDAEDDAGVDTDENESTADATGLAAELVSWAVGVAFGRFDIRLATGARLIPTEPEPFDALPACSPGMLTGGDGLPLACPPVGYPLAFPEAGVLVDDLRHAQDLPTAVRAVFDAVFGADADRWWNDVAALLDPKEHDLRVWLGGSFFEHHLKRHSKSRRKAPILWQLGTPSGRYSVWLYAHRLTRDIFFQLQNEVVGPKLAHEDGKLASLVENAGTSPSATERKKIADQETLVEELRAMLAEIKRVAPLWNSDLDDGVVLTMAPLWRLVPQHKPWQKELKSKWDELAAGKYDWAHLAMHLWPERVVPKCATDRSLAIAHGIEDVFWVEGTNGRWMARPTPVRSIEELVRERSSPAVKAALKSLLDAPTAQTSRGTARSRGAR
ncbi:MAG: hypothetical protein QOF89_1634 [Acidobacteriota bacterium]|jgi:hypothetical protein|nr:hypothetical protein [Acidobacteriota bacterium]